MVGAVAESPRPQHRMAAGLFPCFPGDRRTGDQLRGAGRCRNERSRSGGHDRIEQIETAFAIVGPMANVRVYGGPAKAPTASKEGSPLLAGILTGIALAIAWVALARITHNDVGLASWGVGGLLGIVIAKMARPPTRGTGWLAAILTAGTLLVAKFAVVVFALQPALREEFVQDWRATSGLFLVDMTKNRSFSATLQHTLDTRPDLVRDTSFLGPGWELRSQIDSEVLARAKPSTVEERERLVRAHYDSSLLAQFSFWGLLLVSFGPLDLLWMGLGIAGAWKLGQGLI